MIRRNSANYNQNQEAIYQHSFTALKGIDGSQIATSENTILNSINLDIDYDGGLILRKPLVYNKLYGYDKIHYAYDNSILAVEMGRLRGVLSGVLSLKTIDIYGIRHTLSLRNISEYFYNALDFTDCKFTNTSSSTIVTNVKVNLSELERFTGNTLKTTVESDIQYRMFKLIKEDNTWVMEMVTPEMNHITGKTIALDFNTSLDNPIAVRDNYNSTQTSIKGILGYAISSYTGVQQIDLGNRELEIINTQATYTVGEDVLTLTLTENSIKIFAKMSFKTNAYGFTITLKYYTASNNTNTSVHTVTKEMFNNYVEIPLSTTGFDYIEINAAYAYPSIKDNVLTLTESNSYNFSNNTVSSTGVVLKAFLDNPNVKSNNIFIKWEYSNDGISWESVCTAGLEANSVKVAKMNIKLNEVSDEKTLKWDCEDWWKLESYDMESGLQRKINECEHCLILPNIVLDNTKIVKCTLIKCKPSSEYSEYGDLPEGVDWVLDYELDSKTYIFDNKDSELLNHDFKNPNTGDMLYWNHALYSISPEFKNNIYVSNPDSSVFPVSRMIDLGSFQGTTITKLIPWRDYLVAFTENSVHLIAEQDVGFTTKLVNTFIGVPENDRDTCVSILNGIIFKSGNRLYTLIPNYNSGDESILNISDISKPIVHILENLKYNETYKPFAFTTSENYHLFIPTQDKTICLKYNYSKKIWVQYQYPVVFTGFKMISVDDIRLFSKDDFYIHEYLFEQTNPSYDTLDTYGDTLYDNQVLPISFYVDSGQKTDNISLTKRFVETKIIVATLSSKDTFKLNVSIDVDGNIVKNQIDLNTSGALLRSNSDQILTLGSDIETSVNSDIFNVLRQMLLRYSGKGKTVRHMISGESLYKFKIYEVFYRYKLPIVKQ